MAQGQGNISASMYALSVAAKGKTMHDNIFTKTPGMYWLTKHGRVKSYDGGYAIQEFIEITRNSTVAWRDSKKRIPLAEQDPFRTVQWTPAEVTASDSFYWKDDRRNVGGIKNFVSERINNTEKTFKELFGRSFYADGTQGSIATTGTAYLETDVAPVPSEVTAIVDPVTGLPGGDPTLQGIEAIISDGYDADGTTALGTPAQYYGAFVLPSITTSIDRTAAASAFWCAKVERTQENWTISGGTDGGLAAAVQNARMYEGSEVDLILSGWDIWNYYSSTLQDNQRYVDEETAAAGFMHLAYQNALFVPDHYCPAPVRGCSDNTTPYLQTGLAANGTAGTSHSVKTYNTYCICSDTLWLRPDAPCKENMFSTPAIQLDDTLARNLLHVWAGQMTCMAPRVNSKMINKTLPS